LDNITHPKYGLINKGLVSEEKRTLDKLKWNVLKMDVIFNMLKMKMVLLIFYFIE
jgi:hypothetical protein